MNEQDKMTRELFLAQYKGEWAPSDGLWLGMDFYYAGQEYRFQTDSMYSAKNLILPDGCEARFYMYKKDGTNSDIRYTLVSAHATSDDVLEQCRIGEKNFGQILDDDLIVLLGQD